MNNSERKNLNITQIVSGEGKKKSIVFFLKYDKINGV